MLNELKISISALWPNRTCYNSSSIFMWHLCIEYTQLYGAEYVKILFPQTKKKSKWFYPIFFHSIESDDIWNFLAIYPAICMLTWNWIWNKFSIQVFFFAVSVYLYLYIKKIKHFCLWFFSFPFMQIMKVLFFCLVRKLSWWELCEEDKEVQ